MSKATHPTDAVAFDVCGEHGTEPIPPEPNRLMANVDPSLKQQVLHVSQTERKPHIHHHNQPNDLG